MLLVPIQVDLSDRLILDLKDDVAHEVQNYDAHGLVIEVSGVELFDSFIAGAIEQLSQMARLMGVRTVLAGLNASMAITLVEMGMHLDGVETALDLESALRILGHRAAVLGDPVAGPAKPPVSEDEEALLFGARAP
jgi:rsbT antagonist protein RsbS